MLCISKILKNESNSQLDEAEELTDEGCCVSQRYWKMKAIHNYFWYANNVWTVVVYLKDTEKWKQFTTHLESLQYVDKLLCISKILKNESNSQLVFYDHAFYFSCCVSQRYWKMKAIHNKILFYKDKLVVVVYLKDTEKWKQFTTINLDGKILKTLLCISKILKNESNSQLRFFWLAQKRSCCVSQRYWKMKAIHNLNIVDTGLQAVVVYLKDTEKWKQFTTMATIMFKEMELLCISKILKNESNSQPTAFNGIFYLSCCVSQRYWKMKAIHNYVDVADDGTDVVVYLKDTEKWKQFTTNNKGVKYRTVLLCI